MKFFTKKNITQKIVIVAIISILFGFIFPTYSQADVFGILFDPLFEFITGIGDSILSLLQKYLYNGEKDPQSKLINQGLGNILVGESVLNRFMDEEYKYIPEMKFTGHDSEELEKATVTIQESDFDFISLASLLPSIIVPGYGALTGLHDLLTRNNYTIPTLQYSVDKIFAGQIPAFDINYINPKDWTIEYPTNGDTMNDISITRSLSGAISKWYNALRNLAIVGLLSVLLYTGIRVLISSSLEDRAKYKERLVDWLIAMCLIFAMHYIMAIITYFIQLLNDTIAKNATSIPVVIERGTSIIGPERANLEFNTNLMGLVRLQMQYKDLGAKATFFILYIALIVYTCKYTWVYMKRTITMAFLTLIAPLVAMTYPIDKMNDGKAQAFNAWLKEYIFTALLQPVHLILYTVLVGSAISLAAHNPIYAIMVIAFMGPAEKLLKKFFGFDKATTPGALGTAGAMFGGAAAFKYLKTGVGMLGGGKGSSGGKGDGNVRTRGGNAVEDRNAADGYDAFARSNGRVTAPMGDSARNDNNNDDNSEAMMSNMYLGNDEEYVPNQSNADTRPAISSNIDTDSDEAIEHMMGNMNLNDDSAYASTTADSLEETNNTGATPIRTVDTTNTQQDSQNQQSRAKRLAKFALASPLARAGARQLKDSAIKNFGSKERALDTGKRVLKATARTAGKIAIGGTMAAVGIGMGIVGDDLEDVLKYGAAGVALGASTAPKVVDAVTNSKLAKEARTEWGKAMHGNTNAAAVAEQTSELRSTGELRNWARETFPDKDGNPITGRALNELEDRAIGHYNAGLTDKGEIKRAMKLEDKLMNEVRDNLPEEEKRRQSKEMAETVVKIGRDISPDKLSDDKYVEGKLKQFEKGIKKSNPDLSDRDAKENANRLMNMIMQSYKIP